MRRMVGCEEYVGPEPVLRRAVDRACTTRRKDRVKHCSRLRLDPAGVAVPIDCRSQLEEIEYRT